MKASGVFLFMMVLALEFSSTRRSAALLDLPRLPATAPVRLFGETTEIEARPAKALNLLERLFAKSNVDRAAVEQIVVGLGPGSYTGIRSAIALAQGWQLRYETQLLGVSSADALARRAQHSGQRGLIHVAIDAQRREFYLASYRAGPEGCEAIAPVRLAALGQVEQLVAGGELVAGPGLTRWFPRALDLEPGAQEIGILAAGRGDFVAGEKLEPIYLRDTAFIKATSARMK